MGLSSAAENGRERGLTPCSTGGACLERRELELLNARMGIEMGQGEGLEERGAKGSGLDQELRKRLERLPGRHGSTEGGAERRGAERSGDEVTGRSQLEARSPGQGMRQAMPNALLISCNGGGLRVLLQWQ